MKFDKAYFERLSPTERYERLLEFLEQAGDHLRPGGGQQLVHALAGTVAGCMNDTTKLSWREEQELAKVEDGQRKSSVMIVTMLQVCLPPAGRLHFLVSLKENMISLSGRN